MDDSTSADRQRQTDGTARIQAAWKRELPDLADASIDSIAVITRIWRLAALFDAERRRTLDQLGTDASTLDLLSTLRRSGDPYRLTVKAITERSLVTQGAISQRITRAESAGLVRRDSAPNDGRSVVVALTPKGRRLNERAVRALLAHEADLLSSLAPAERDQLAATLQNLLSSLTIRVGGDDGPGS